MAQLAQQTDSSSNGEVWEDGDVDQCRCRFESFPVTGFSDSESDTVSLPGSESSARVSEGGEHADDPPLLPVAFVATKSSIGGGFRQFG